MSGSTGGRVMAFDWGLNNIGVAVGNIALGTSQPCAIVKAKNGTPDWQKIGALITEWQPEQLVVGEPLNMDGSDSEIAPRARKFSRQLAGRFNLPVALADERLSSNAAKSASRERGHQGDYGSHPIDDEAADIILQTWLNSQSAGN